jgi:hypothetical protein
MTEQVKREPTPMHLQVEKINIQINPANSRFGFFLSLFFLFTHYFSLRTNVLYESAQYVSLTKSTIQISRRFAEQI